MRVVDFPEPLGPRKQPLLGQGGKGSGGCLYAHFFSAGRCSILHFNVEPYFRAAFILSKSREMGFFLEAAAIRAGAGGGAGPKPFVGVLPLEDAPTEGAFGAERG